jgi:hypothetical protein
LTLKQAKALRNELSPWRVTWLSLFTVWGALVPAAPFIAYRLGWNQGFGAGEFLIPPVLLFLAALALSAKSGAPRIAEWAAGAGSWVAGLMLMNESMSPGTHFGRYRQNWGQFDGLIVLIALALGGGALVTGLIIGRMARETTISQP